MMHDEGNGRDEPEDPISLPDLAKHCGLEFVDISAVAVSEELLSLLSPEVARHYGVLPIKRSGLVVTVAMADPSDFDTLDSLRYILNSRIEVAICDPEKLRKAIDQHYGVLGGE